MVDIHPSSAKYELQLINLYLLLNDLQEKPPKLSREISCVRHLFFGFCSTEQELFLFCFVLFSSYPTSNYIFMIPSSESYHIFYHFLISCSLSCSALSVITFFCVTKADMFSFLFLLFVILIYNKIVSFFCNCYSSMHCS